MREVLGGVVINEIEAEPLSDYVIDFLKRRKSESPYLDFKLTINTGKGLDFPEIAKDIFAFSNYGGGWVLLGWQELKKNQYFPVGLPESFELEQAILQEKFNSFVDEPLQLLYREITEVTIDGKKRFGFIYVPPSHKLLVPNKEGKYNDNGKDKIVFKKGDIFYRRGTQSIHPSEQELVLINKRLEKENYRLSVLSGEPDEIEEELYSNLFEAKKIPKYVYLGNKKPYDDVSIKFLLKQNGVFPEFYYKFKDWNNKIVTFENLQDENNIYSKLVEEDSITRESVESWLNEADKSRLIIELLNKELKHYAISKKIFYNKDRDKLFYTTETETRKEQWKSRYGKATRTVATKMYATQLQRLIYCHVACYANFMKIGNKIYLRILPTFILTEDGRRVLAGFKEGTIITRLSYNKYNNSYFNTVMFWAHQLGDGKNISIRDYIEIDVKPVSSKLPFGILFDVPSTEFKLPIEDGEIGEDIISEEEGEHGVQS